MSNGGIIGVINTPTASVASGVWTLNEVLLARSQSIWPGQPISVDYLVVAGGGGGGASGAGAGGLRSTVTATGGGGSLESALLVNANSSYTITVGAGGVGNSSLSTDSTNGSNSTFSAITSTGGGRGSRLNTEAGQSGGCGGGAFSDQNNTPSGGAGTANQGFAGGNVVTNAAALVLSSCAIPIRLQSPTPAVVLHLPLQQMAAIKSPLLLPALATFPSRNHNGTLRIPR
jgi:hypothetical protein